MNDHSTIILVLCARYAVDGENMDMLN